MDAKRKSLIGALLLGLLSGPVIALAASGAFSGGEAQAAPAPAAVETTVTPTTTTAADIPAVTATDARADLVTACTVDGPMLADAETAGTINEVEVAALDALRDICGAAGMPLADAPAADPEIIEVVQVQPVTVSASGSTEYEEYEHEDDEDESHEYEEYEHEDDENESHEYEGEDD